MHIIYEPHLHPRLFVVKKRQLHSVVGGEGITSYKGHYRSSVFVILK